MSSGTVTLLIPERSGRRDRGFDAFAGGCNGDYGFRQVTGGGDFHLDLDPGGAWP